MRDSIHVPVLALSVVLFACSSPGGSTSGLGNSGGSDAVDDASAVTDGDAAQATDAATINATQDGNTASDSAVALKDSAGGQTQKDSAGGQTQKDSAGGQTQKDSAGGDATTNCSPTTKGSCGQNGYCKGSSCTKCPLGKHNCDGVGDCESSAACGITKCDKTCTDANESHCVKNPAQKNRCEACLTDAHCQSNPRSDGPFCDTSDLAGTGFNFCICKTDGDCANSTVGKLCKPSPGASNPKFKVCTCSADKDCPTTHPLCEGTMFKKCKKKCTSDSDCVQGSIQGTCATMTGKCSFPSFP
jgi:hypothetical protein